MKIDLAAYQRNAMRRLKRNSSARNWITQIYSCNFSDSIIPIVTAALVKLSRITSGSLK